MSRENRAFVTKIRTEILQNENRLNYATNNSNYAPYRAKSKCRKINKKFIK